MQDKESKKKYIFLSGYGTGHAYSVLVSNNILWPAKAIPMIPYPEPMTVNPFYNALDIIKWLRIVFPLFSDHLPSSIRHCSSIVTSHQHSHLKSRTLLSPYAWPAVRSIESHLWVWSKCATLVRDGVWRIDADDTLLTSCWLAFKDIVFCFYSVCKKLK